MASALGAMAVVLVPVIVVIRLALTLRQRRERALRPPRETSIALYLAGGAAPPAEGTTGRERATLLTVALDVLPDLRGSERARLVALLQQLGYVDDLTRGLHARRRVSRRRAADMLATIAAESAAPALAAALRDPDILVRTTCAATLTEVGGSAVVPEIVATIALAADIAPGAAAAAVLGLGLNRPAALASLLAPDAAPAMRRMAVVVAGELRLWEHSRLLASCLASDDLAVAAARGLGRIGETEAVPALIALATDAGRPLDARAAATRALGRIGDASALPALGAQLRDQDWFLQAAAAEALHGLGQAGDAALLRAASSMPGQLGELADAVLHP